MKLKVQLDAKGEWQAVEPPRETVETIEAAAPDVAILVGGAAVDRRFELRPKVTVCRHVSDLVGQVEALVQRAGAN